MPDQEPIDHEPAPDRQERHRQLANARPIRTLRALVTAVHLAPALDPWAGETTSASCAACHHGALVGLGHPPSNGGWHTTSLDGVGSRSGRTGTGASHIQSRRYGRERSARIAAEAGHPLGHFPAGSPASSRLGIKWRAVLMPRPPSPQEGRPAVCLPVALVDIALHGRPASAIPAARPSGPAPKDLIGVNRGSVGAPGDPSVPRLASPAR